MKDSFHGYIGRHIIGMDRPHVVVTVQPPRPGKAFNGGAIVLYPQIRWTS